MTTGARAVERGRNATLIEDLAIAPNIFGSTWYVDVTNGSNSNTGRSPRSAFSTLAQAQSSSSAGDTIVIAPGSYPIDVATASLAPKADQLWMAAQPSYGGAPNVIIVADADDSANAPVAIDVDNVTFKDIEFRLVAGGTTALFCVDAAQTTAVRGLVFKDCWFNMNSVDGSGVIACRFNDATNAIVGLVMKNCRFIGGDATTNQAKYIVVGVGGLDDALIEDCIFVMESADGDCLAIEFLDPTAAGGSYGITVRNNDFIGPQDGGGDAIAITVAAAMTEDEIVGMFRTNYMSNCTASITIDKINNSVIRNYEGDNATGGTLVDPGT